jgi:hypothetical protein
VIQDQKVWRKLMRVTVLYALLAASLSFNSCGSKDDSPADFYQSCEVPNIVGDTDLRFCIESKNSTDFQPTCEEKSGTYAQTQCDVPTGTKGCSYKNSNGVALTDWYSSDAWTAESQASDCAQKTDGELITKP